MAENEILQSTAVDTNNEYDASEIQVLEGLEAVRMREREEAEEDRFRRLDAAIRGNIRKKDEQKEKKLWKKKKPSQA